MITWIKLFYFIWFEHVRGQKVYSTLIRMLLRIFKGKYKIYIETVSVFWYHGYNDAVKLAFATIINNMY